MAKTVVGLFDDRNDAQNVVQDLINRGINRNDISLVANDTAGRGATSTGTGKDTGQQAAEGAGAGAVGGTVVGGVVGLLVGVGALAIPGIGPVLAAGPLAAALGSTALGAGIGAAAGGLLGALVGAGVPEEDAHRYTEGVRRGGTLVTVKADNSMADQVYDIMQQYHAVDINERSTQWKQEGWNRFDPGSQPYSSSELDNFRSARPSTGATSTTSRSSSDRRYYDVNDGGTFQSDNSLRNDPNRPY